MSTYYIHLKRAGSSEPAERFTPVDGFPLTPEGFEGFDLFVHQARYWDGSPLAHCWCVSEGRSGFLLAEGDNGNEAIANATEKLRRKGAAAFRDVIAKAISIGGLSPRWSQLVGDDELWEDADREVQEMVTG